MAAWGGPELLDGELANVVLDFEEKKRTLDFKDSGRRVLELHGSRSWMRVRVKMSRLREAYDEIFGPVFRALKGFLLYMANLKNDFAVLCAGGCWSNQTIWRDTEDLFQKAIKPAAEARGVSYRYGRLADYDRTW